MSGRVVKGTAALPGVKITAKGTGEFVYTQWQEQFFRGSYENNSGSVCLSMYVQQPGVITSAAVGLEFQCTELDPVFPGALGHDGLVFDVQKGNNELPDLYGHDMLGLWELCVSYDLPNSVGFDVWWILAITYQGTIETSTTTRADGSYKLNLQPGIYTVSASMNGETFSPAYRTVTVASNRTSINFAAKGPPISSLSIAPRPVIGGQGSVGTVTLAGPALPGGTAVYLSSSRPEATVPATLTIPDGQTQGTFPIATVDVPASVSTTIAASANGDTKLASLTIKRNDIASLSLSPTGVFGGLTSTGNVTLLGPAPPGGKIVVLASDQPEAIVPLTVSVAAGQSTATFAITTTNPVADIVANISATLNVTKTKPLSIRHFGLSGLSLSPSVVWAGQISTGTVTLTGPARAPGQDVALSSSSVRAIVPASVTIPEGKSKVTFQIVTDGASPHVFATITAAARGDTSSATLDIQRIRLSSFSLSPSTVTGGAVSTGTVTLNGPAPPEGAVISLTSGDPNAIVPASVTVFANQTSATFKVRTSPVTSQVVAAITASLVSSIGRSLTINPP